MKPTFSCLKLGIVLVIIIFISINNKSCCADLKINENTLTQQHDNDVTVSLVEYGSKKFVTGSIVINEPPKLIWPIVVNPFEYKDQINEHLKNVEVELDCNSMSRLKCMLEYCFILPKIYYVVESKYTPLKSVAFKSLSGTIKDFEGFWHIEPVNNGKFSLVTFSMYLEPGIPVPPWIVRQGVKMELPKTLYSLRTRIYKIYNEHAKLARRNIKAALIPQESCAIDNSVKILVQAKVR